MKEEALHPCRDLIGKRKESVSDSGDEVQLPSSTTADVRLSPVEEEALGLVQEILEADSEIRAGTSRADAVGGATLTSFCLSSARRPPSE